MDSLATPIMMEAMLVDLDHVAVLTNAGEVYTWGKGANVRLGHGDTADRKWVSVMEQSQCEGLLHPGDPFMLLASELLKQEVQKLKEEVTVTTVVNTAPKSSLARGTASFQDANELLKQEVQKLKEEVCLVLYIYF